VTFFIYLDMVSDQAILQAAIAILSDDFSAPLDLIADKAGVNRRTLYRRYQDREQLISACRKETMLICKAAMNFAYNSDLRPLKQLERMLYAGIDCNYKYAFLNKLQQREQPKLINDHDKNDLNDNVKIKWRELIITLQKEGIINSDITVHWVFFLFDGMISTTITAMESGDVAINDIKYYAWKSFAQSIGIILK
jgi:AcrR family transcriptional regulator